MNRKDMSDRRAKESKDSNKNIEENTKTDGKRKKKPIFERLGEFVTNNYKVIVIVSLVVLGAAVYPAISLLGVVKYNETEFLPKNLDINRGEEIFNEQFGGNFTSGSTVIVIDSDERISNETNLQYITTLTEWILGNYSHIVEEVQSILTVFDYYNESLWSELTQTEEMIYETLLDNLTYANEEMYQTREMLEKNIEQIATLYELSWFNFSRTYFFGRYNTSLFTTGPSPAIYQSILSFTNFTAGYAVSSSYTDQVYDVINGTMSNPFALDDAHLHDIILDLVNTTLYQSLGMPANYTQTVYPLLSIYHYNWSSVFNQQLTGQGMSIVNGTNIDANVYNSSSLTEAYSSQETVLSILKSLNETAYPSIKELVLAGADDLLDFTGTPIEEYLDPEMLHILLEQIFNLGENPDPEVIAALVRAFTGQLMSSIIATSEQPPPETIDDIPLLLSQWLLSEDGKTTLVYVAYNLDKCNGTTEEKEGMLVDVDKEIGELAHELAEEVMNLEYTRVYQTGEIFIGASLADFSAEDFSRIDIITIIFVTVVLLIVFGSFIAPLIPIVCIGTAVLVSMAVIRLFAFGMDFHFLSLMILMVTSFGAGVDYAIFIFSRYAEERNKNGLSKQEAMKLSIMHAGESVMHSGLTVMIGFGAMIIPNFPLLRCLGVAMITGISLSIISALIFVPSIVLVIGDWIWWPKFLQKIVRPNKWFRRKKAEIDADDVVATSASTGETKESLEVVPEGTPVYVRKAKEKEQPKERFLLRFAHFITKHGTIIIILTLVLFSPLVYFITNMDTTIDFLSLLPEDFDGRKAKDALSDNTMAFGDPTPTQLLIHNMSGSPLDLQALEDTELLCIALKSLLGTEPDLSGQYLELEHITTIRTTVRPLGLTIPYNYPGALDVYGSYDFVGKDNRTLLLEIFLDANPYSKEAEKFVAKLPEAVEICIEKYHLSSFAESDIYCLGVARSLYELKMVTDNAYPIVVPVVVVGVFLVLFFLFGSYLTPVRLILTIGMSILFTLAMLQLVFAIGFGVGLFWLLPLMLFSILLGLGLDFDIFLVSRVKEYCQAGMSDREAIAHALDRTATIITSCGLVMAAAYSSLMFSKLWHLRQLGFAFTLSILLDATVIRLIIVPAIMVVMEKWNWTGPKWLQKVRHQSSIDNPVMQEEELENNSETSSNKTL